IDGVLTSGIITETEAYAGIKDKASHAYGGKLTPRNKVMYKEGGYAYVYLCYGIHYLFNVVTNEKNIPDAVLIRSIEPFHGKYMMEERLKSKKMKAYPIVGPGKVTVALGISLIHNGLSLFKPPLYIADVGIQIEENQIITTTRIGIDYAEEDALLPYRFLLKKEA
ncbi:MAG: DNA-3-methyladenine glycosylase, partial [Bacteroidales bacterium]|nr:DNA-3-methyladenine glycosylase [Bacteroidales bacterium]